MLRPLLILFILLSCAKNDVKSQTPMVKENLSKALIIDVRSKAEYDDGHIKDAIHIPYQEIGKRIKSVTEDKTKRILLYCASGGRSGIALTTLKSLGYMNTTNEGGISDLKRKLSH